MVKLSRTVMNGELVEGRQYWDRYWAKSVDLRFSVRMGTQTGALSVAAREETRFLQPKHSLM